MRLPALKEIPTSRDFIENFGGYNHNVRIGENEFYDMKNLTSDHYPVLATRPKRGKTDILSEDGRLFANPDRERRFVGLISKDKVFTVYADRRSKNKNETYFLVRVDNEPFCIQTTEPFPYNVSAPRQVISMGVYGLVFPDGFYFNTEDKADFGWIRKKHQINPVEVGNVKCSGWFNPCTKDGEIIQHTPLECEGEDNGEIALALEKHVEEGSAKRYRGPVNNCYLRNCETGVFYYWNKSSDSWLTYTPEYMLCASTNVRRNGDKSVVLLSDVFEDGDGVRISGFDKTNETDKEILAQVFDDDIERPFFIEKVIKDTYAVTENGTAIQEESAGIVFKISPKLTSNELYSTLTFMSPSVLTFETVIPKMDFVIESSNRLWGCRHGENNKGDMVNEIYATKLGDFRNWETFSGVSTDSYMASLGSDGSFTGAISYLGMPTFFKQNCIHTVYGNFPATYQIQTTECKGVQQGCDKSLIELNGALFYKSVGGVCAYMGSMPTEISMQLNEIGTQFIDAVAGGYRNKYYIAMKDLRAKNPDERWLYVYDIDKGLWHKESPLDVSHFIEISTQKYNGLYYLVKNRRALGQIDCNSTNAESPEKVDWMAETGVLGCSSPDKKYISRISIRLSIGIGTRVYVYAEYDSSGTWEQLGAITGTSLNTFTFPVRPKRCDHLRLRIEGTDEAKIYSISKTYEQGSDI